MHVYIIIYTIYRYEKMHELTCIGKSLPGTAGIPVMKSLVQNGLSTTERWHDNVRHAVSRSKCIGIKTTGIWLMAPIQPLEANT